MDFLTSKLRSFRGIFSEKVETKRQITWLEGYLQLCYKILSWEDISLTLTTFLIINFVFWLVIQLQLRCFGVIFLLALAAFVADGCFEVNQRFALETAHLELIDGLKKDLNSLILSLKALRQDNPSSFCIGMSVLFLLISFIAKNTSGYVIFYLILLAVFFMPLAVANLPPHYVASVKSFIKTLNSEKEVLAEDDLIPFLTDKDYTQRDPDLDSLISEKTADSVTNSLISGLSSMPSHLDAEDKESLDEDEFLPSGSTADAISGTPGDISTDSDSDNKGIRFDSGHFKGDSSSDEDQYTKNLDFDARDSVERQIVSNIIAATGENLMKVANAIKEVVTPATTAVQRKDSSSDSEFEIINTDEANEQ